MLGTGKSLSFGKEGKGHGSAAHCGTQFEPQTTGVEKAYNRFARQLADYLNKVVADQNYDRVALIASAPMLGVLRSMLSSPPQ